MDVFVTHDRHMRVPLCRQDVLKSTETKQHHHHSKSRSASSSSSQRPAAGCTATSSSSSSSSGYLSSSSACYTFPDSGMMGDLQLDDADAASLLGSVVDQCELSELLDTLTQSQDGGCGGGSGAAAALVMAAADIADFSLDSLDSLGAGVGAGLASSDTAAAAAGGGCISNDALSTQFDSSQQPGSAFNSELIDRLSCGFTSHSTQKMSFQ